MRFCEAIEHVVLPDKSLWNVLLSIEVGATWGVEWEVWVDFAAVVTAIVHTTHVPERPSRSVRGSWNVASVRLHKVDVIQRRYIASARQ